MENINDLKADFCIKIDFERKSGNPARVFEAMSELIKAFQLFDKDLISSIDSKIEPVMFLEDIEIGSLKTWFISVLRGAPDEAIKDLDVKKAIGLYLVKAKYILLNRLEGKTLISDSSEIQDIQYEMVQEAEKTDVKQFPNYTPIPLQKIVQNIDNINNALLNLNENDRASLITSFGEANFNLELNFSPESIEDLITKEKIDSVSTMILRIKKPDYLGTSMWDFRHGTRLISAKICDINWLEKFHSRKVDIRPGDSFRARVNCTVKYGYDFSVVGTSYDVLEVIEIIYISESVQGSLNLPDNDNEK